MKQNSGISSYNKLIYSSGPIKVSDYISGNPDKIHQKLYEEALSRFYIDYPEFDMNPNIKIMEIKNKEFWMAPSIQLIDYTKKPLKRYNFSLEKYWINEYVERKEEGKIPEELGSSNDEIDYFNYINGKATMLDKYKNDKYKIDFSKLGQDIKLSDEYNVFPETFQYKKMYGNF